jgi:hypothetical protein
MIHRTSLGYMKRHLLVAAITTLIAVSSVFAETGSFFLNESCGHTTVAVYIKRSDTSFSGGKWIAGHLIFHKNWRELDLDCDGNGECDLRFEFDDGERIDFRQHRLRFF